MPSLRHLTRLMAYLPLVLLLLNTCGATVPTVATAPTADTPTAAAAPVPATQRGFALRFFGTNTDDRDRVKLPLGPLDAQGRLTGSSPVNIGGDFTIEFWMRAEAAENSAGACAGQGWYYGNIIIDRDVFGDDIPDYGIALCAGRIVFGVNTGNNDHLLVGETVVTTNQWHHVAVTRNMTGQMRIFVDGQLDGSTNGPAGDLAYPLGRTTDWPLSDPYLVFAAEKHDYPGSLGFAGYLDDIHLSSVVRYTSAFQRPDAPHQADQHSVALYRFDEGEGRTITDAISNANPGILNPNQNDPSRHWVSETPFALPTQGWQLFLPLL